jgi:3-deoxy-manno-octulosonate cytidylyltransferase (CMP-KDO synthetase)
VRVCVCHDTTPRLLPLRAQCYDAAFLAGFAALPATPLAQAEDLEQLKVLEHGHKLRVVTLDDGPGAAALPLAHGVDEPADVAKIEAALAARRAAR